MSSQLLQYYSIKVIYSYRSQNLQLQITKFKGHRNTMKKTKGQVKFTIQVVGQKKKSQFGKTQVFMSNHWSSRARFY